MSTRYPWPGPSLTIAVSGTGGETIVAFEAIAAGQASLRFVARRRRVESARRLRRNPSIRFGGCQRLSAGSDRRRCRPADAASRTIDRRRFRRRLDSARRATRRRYAAPRACRGRRRSSPTVRRRPRRRRRTIPGWPVIMSRPTINRAVGAERRGRALAQEAAFRLLAQRQHDRVGRQRFELSGRLRHDRRRRASIISTVSSGPTISLMVVSHLILMPSSTASSASKACAGMCARSRR